MSEPIHAVIDSLRQHAERHLDDLKAFLRIPSVSADSRCKADVARAAEFVRQQLAQGGCHAELIPTPGHPIVYGEWTGAPGAPTVLVYGHYDVQPPDPLEKWLTPPFEPDVRNGCLYARGATDDKGQMLTHVKSVQAWLHTVGRLPVNVKFVIEGEEEVGSNNLENFLKTNRQRCQCDVAVISDTAQYGPGIPAITYGLRGILACEFVVHGPRQDVHSGVFGGAIANPVNGLARLLALIHDEQGRVMIPGFYEGVIPLSDQERRDFAQLPFEEAEFLGSLGVSTGWGEAGFSTIERRWARPTCDVNGIIGGYTGEGPKTIIPSQALAKLTCRLVPGQSPDELLRNLEAFLRANLLPGLRLEFKKWHGCEAVLCERESAFMQAAQTAISKGFSRAPVLIREGGSIPVVATFKQQLGVDTLLLGWGQNTDNLHGPNEHFSIEDYQRGILSSAWLWHEFGQIPQPGTQSTRP
jgi:acetylornithine deacetylase/succinyl-diaminopimelate desuccinylase-like protein